MEEETKYEEENKKIVVNPLSAWMLKYPPEVQQAVNEPMHKVNQRGIGAKYGIYWLHHNLTLHLWSYDSIEFPNALRIERKFTFKQGIRCIAMGKIVDK